MLRHFGNPEHPRNLPLALSLIAIGLLHLSHLCSVISSSTFGNGLPFEPNRIVFLHSGNPAHAKNGPFLPPLITINLSHSVHTTSDNSGSAALSKSSLKGPYKELKTKL